MVGKEQARPQSSAHGPNLPSLLWPDHVPSSARRCKRIGREAAADLDLAPIVRELTGGESRHETFVTSILMELCTDPDVVAYRADVISNVLDNVALHEQMRDAMPHLSTLVREPPRPVGGYEWDVGQIVQRLGDLEVYVSGTLKLSEVLETPGVTAAALVAVRTAVRALVASPQFQTLRQELPALRSRVESVQSVTIGVNLAGDLRPESATILSIDAERVDGHGGFLGRLVGREAGRRGVSKLQGTAGPSMRSFFPTMDLDAQEHENALMRDLRRLLEGVMAPVGEAIEQFVWAHTRSFTLLESEMSFVLNAVALIEHLRACGLPVCRPDIVAMDERVSYLEDGYNISLALRTLRSSARQSSGNLVDIVTNPIAFDELGGRIWILTGPNRGGKTTYVRAVGLAHLLFQAGLHVPARTARLSPVDAIFTHFPTSETTSVGQGRLDDEAARLAEIFHEAGRHSLILLNEVLSGTSTLEALALAYDVTRGLRLLGARAIYVTHLHELARRATEINLTTSGDGTVRSLVAGVDPLHDGTAEHRRTFCIRPRDPEEQSYASDVAREHGITFPQLHRLLQTRGVITDELADAATSHAMRVRAQQDA
ncbi:MAG: hypothetical protein PVSMB7_18370 [Chloroflexota bacterium]